MISRKIVDEECAFDSTYSKGTLLFAKGKVLDYSESENDDGTTTIEARVRGIAQPFYHISLTVTDKKIKSYDCDCPAMLSYYGMCKHCAATALTYITRHEGEEGPSARSGIGKAKGTCRTSRELTDLMSSYGAAQKNAENDILPGSVHLTASLLWHPEAYNYRSGIVASVDITLQISAARGRAYIVKDISQLLYNVTNTVYHAYGKGLAFTHSAEMFDAESRELLRCLHASMQNEHLPIESYGNPSARYRTVTLSSAAADRLLGASVGSTVSIGGESYAVCEGDPEIPMQLHGGAGGSVLTVPLVYTFLSRLHPWVCFRGTLWRVTPDFAAGALPILQRFGALQEQWGRPENDRAVKKTLSEKDYAAFYATLLPRLNRWFKVEISGVDFSEYRLPDPEFSFRLTPDDAGGICLEPTVSYAGSSYGLFEAGKEYRAAAEEQPVRSLVREYFTEKAPQHWCLETEDEIFRFLETGLDRFREVGDVLVDEKLRSTRIAPTPRVTVGVGLSGSLIDLDVDVPGLSPEEMAELLGAYRMKKRYYRLRSGEYLSLEGNALSVVRELSEGLRLREADGFRTQLPAFRAQYINEVVTDHADIELRRSVDFRRLIRDLRSFADSDYAVPGTLHAVLRNYQQDGFLWMCALAECGLGGILADEMGLGKTVQAIAYLLHTGKNALIVCPASLVYNWESELRRFAPSLRVMTVQGPAAQRADILSAEDGADVHVTSYDLLKRDSTLYAGHTFGTVLIDEAQYIRNAGTQAAKAVKQLCAEQRFALTGTPMENRLSDLWSIFDFLMPGFLYTYPEFRRSLEQPILGGDEEAQLRLKRMIAPFILCRKKADVLKELPDKVESIQYVEMTETQQKLYLAHEQQLRESLLRTDDTDFASNRIEYLSALMRLRQLCCDPALFLENYSGGSGKTEACIELLGELTESGHRVLVFSQFTSMLDILRAAAERKGLTSLCLTGASTKEQRRAMVEEFQKGGASVFFISLKAGGVGLNLTAADRVVHVDPWWNAAAEDQASDRAHRIGQKNTVFITKLVARGTVEERILALQEAKRDLSRRVLGGGDTAFGSLNREELLALLSSRQSEEKS